MNSGGHSSIVNSYVSVLESIECHKYCESVSLLIGHAKDICQKKNQTTPRTSGIKP